MNDYVIVNLYQVIQILSLIAQLYFVFYLENTDSSPKGSPTRKYRILIYLSFSIMFIVNTIDRL